MSQQWSSSFREKFEELQLEHERLILRRNSRVPFGNGIYDRWNNPILTAAHTPLFWRYDLDEDSNPHFMERLGINAVFNAGAILHEGRYLLVARVEGHDRKSFFAIAESPNGVDQFRFWDHPLSIPQNREPDVNVYDMRLVRHEDGWIYGLFCTERKDKSRPEDTSAAEAQCGLVRTKDLRSWHRLPDLITYSGQQRNVVLHPEFIDGKYALYTRPQDGFISVGSGGGIGWGLCTDITQAEIREETIVDFKVYHTIKEMKNGQGPAPIKTDKGWLHLAHGVRNTAAGLRYVLYMFMTSLEKPWIVTHRPGGYFIAPYGDERVGDVSNVTFSNGWIMNDNDEIFIYYASSDTRMHVATTNKEKLTDYVINTPEDPLLSHLCAQQRHNLIQRNLEILKKNQ